MIEIKNRWSGEVICTGEVIAEAVKSNLSSLSGADLSGADLSNVDLRNVDLGGACLSGVNLRNADLRGAYLAGADLGGADLGGVYLAGACLHGADLSGAYLRGAYLGGAYFGGAKVAWQSNDLIAEILKRSAGDDIAKLKVAGLILVCIEKCWSEFVDMRDPLTGWALGVLRECIVDGDDHPDCLGPTEDRER